MRRAQHGVAPVGESVAVMAGHRPIDHRDPSVGVVAGGLRVRPAGLEDLGAAERVMREVLDQDLGGYRPQWHRDLDDLEAAYLRRAGCGLWVARLGGEVVGTAAVRPCVLASPTNPAWLVARYSRPEVCQLVRVWVTGRARRRGAGRRLAAQAVAWSVGPGGYRTVYLHTDAGVPGAEAFWRSLPTRQVHDSRPDPFNCVHFEVDAPAMGSLDAGLDAGPDAGPDAG